MHPVMHGNNSNQAIPTESYKCLKIIHGIEGCLTQIVLFFPFMLVWYHLFIVYSLINGFSTEKMQVLYTERCSKDYNKDYL